MNFLFRMVVYLVVLILSIVAYYLAFTVALAFLGSTPYSPLVLVLAILAFLLAVTDPFRIRNT